MYLKLETIIMGKSGFIPAGKILITLITYVGKIVGEIHFCIIKVWEWGKNQRFTVDRERRYSLYSQICYILALYISYRFKFV